MKSFYHNLFSENLTIPDCLKPNYLPGLDGLRALSIIIVLAGHFFMNTNYRDTFVGSIGVDIFFVISGFLITSLLLKEKVNTGKISLKRFYLRRVIRIIPVGYLFILTLILLNSILKLNIQAHSFVSSALFLQNIPHISGYNWYVQHYWSLSVEEQFYLLFPFLLAYRLKVYVQIIITLIIFVVIVEYLGFNNIGVFSSNAFVHIGAFIVINLFGFTVPILIGSLFAILLFKEVLSTNDTPFLRWLSLILIILAFLIRIDSSPLNIPYSRLFLFPALVAYVIVLNLNKKSTLSIFLNRPILTYIGKLSYSIYIWQQLFSNLLYSIVGESIWLRLLTIMTVSVISFHLYEKQFLKLKRHFAAKF